MLCLAQDFWGTQVSLYLNFRGTFTNSGGHTKFFKFLPVKLNSYPEISVHFLFKFELDVDSFGSRRGVEHSEVVSFCLSVSAVALVFNSPANYYFYIIPRRSQRDIVLVSSVRTSVCPFPPSVHTFCLSGTISQYLLVRFDSFLVKMISTMTSRYPISLVKIDPLTLELLSPDKVRGI